MAKKIIVAKKGMFSSGLPKLALQIVAALLTLYGIFWWRLNARVDKVFEQIQMMTTASHGRASFSLNGDIHIARISIDTPPGPQGVMHLRMGKLTFHTPGLWWLTKVAFTGLEGQDADRLGVTMTNFEFDAPQLAKENSPLGLYSGALFEADGCDSASWTRADLRQMGLPVQDSIATVDYRELGKDSAELTIGMGTPGAGRIDVRVGFDAVGIKSNPMAAVGATLTAAQITFHDEGFIAARNTWCAGKAKITPEQFVERHVQAVRANLAAGRLQADAPLEQVFRGYASKGGDLLIQMRPQAGFVLANFGRYRFEDLRQLLSPIVELNGKDPVLLALGPVTAPDPVENDAAGTTPQSTSVTATPAATTSNPAPVATTPGAAANAATTTVVTAPKMQESAPLVAYAGSQTGDVAATESNEYALLRQAVGQDVVIRTTNGTTRRGKLMHFSNAMLDLQLGPRDGGILLSIPRQSVRDVGVVVATAPPAPAEEGIPDAKKK
ncbi:MAG: hypothetical protein ABI411_11280 [Tahibacter sp.]